LDCAGDAGLNHDAGPSPPTTGLINTSAA
jgi:hypothetical protein